MRSLSKYIAVAALVLGLTGATAQAQIKLTENETQKLYITINTVGTAQALNHKNAFDPKGNQLAKVSPGFQNAFGDLGFIGKFGKNEEITVVMDLYLSSRNHPSQTYGNEGYILMRGVPENLQSLHFLKPVLEKVDVKAGHMLIDFGDAGQHRSNNAIVQNNPLVGNFVVDPNIVSIGMQLNSKLGRFGWLVGGSNGTTTENWSEVLREYLARWQEMSGDSTSLTLDPNIHLRASHELQLVRIVQEALTNVRKHAKATQARIDIQRSGNELTATIADDGLGFNSAARARGEFPQFGLSTMRERAESIGGTLTVDSTPGKGTTVRFTLPLHDVEG
jgi:hypothetical protein